MLDIIRADDLIKPRREANGFNPLLELQTCPRGDNATRTAGFSELLYRFRNAVVHRDFVQTVIRQRFPASHDWLNPLGRNA